MRDYWRFECESSVRAWSDIRAFFGLNFRTLIFALVSLVSWPVLFLLGGKEQLVEELYIRIAFVLIPSGLLILFSVFLAPFRVWQSQKDTLGSVRAELADLQSALSPQLEISVERDPVAAKGDPPPSRFWRIKVVNHGNETARRCQGQLMSFLMRGSNGVFRDKVLPDQWPPSGTHLPWSRDDGGQFEVDIRGHGGIAYLDYARIQNPYGHSISIPSRHDDGQPRPDLHRFVIPSGIFRITISVGSLEASWEPTMVTFDAHFELAHGTEPFVTEVSIPETVEGTVEGAVQEAPQAPGNHRADY